MTENEAKNFHVNTDMFGQYAKIPTGRSGDLHIYKIIARFHSNWYCDVPIIGLDDSTLHEEVTDVLNVIHCGVDESKVIRVALKDCEIIENEETKELRKYREIGTVEECREAVERQKPKEPKDSLKINPVIDGNIWRERKMKIHKLKLNAKYYEDSERGIKTFEIRKNDRDYKIGDVLELREYIEDIRGLGYYTGNVHWKIITYILDDDLYLAPGYVCLGLSPIAEPEQEDAE